MTVFESWWSRSSRDTQQGYVVSYFCKLLHKIEGMKIIKQQLNTQVWMMSVSAKVSLYFWLLYLQSKYSSFTLSIYWCLRKKINTLKKIKNHNKIICYFVQSVYTLFDLLILEKFIYTVNNLTTRKPREREKCPSQWCNWTFNWIEQCKFYINTKILTRL